MKKSFLFSFIFVLLASGLNAQILNVESQRIHQDSTGWVGKGDLLFNLTSNQQQVLDFNTSLHVQYRQNKNTYILLGGAGMIRAGKSDFDNSGHIHFRYNCDLNPWLTWEAFAQGQYNRVLMIDHRELIGTGPRFQLLNAENSKLYTASLYMFEHEVLVEDKTSQFYHRISSYVAFNWKINDHVAMNNIVYFQPAINNFDDHRIMLQSGLKFKFTEIVGFTVNFNLLHNSSPPEGVTKTVYSVRNGLEVRL
jgi:putative salt-induced outer membrane protein YdiY